MLRTGRIYKIICSQSNDVYVGSTFNSLKYRWQGHKCLYKRWMDGKTNNLSIYSLFQKHDIENFKIILIKEYEVEDKNHLEAYEQLWINKLKPINKVNPFQIKKLSAKQYREANKETITQYKKRWHETNRESVKVKQKQYRESNKEVLNEKKKEKITCECGTDYTRSHKARHENTKKHQSWLSSN